jgi:signal transduction histidine kinase/CheY-like chemotaxis protein
MTEQEGCPDAAQQVDAQQEAGLINAEIRKVSQRYLAAMALVAALYFSVRGPAFYFNTGGTGGLVLAVSGTLTALVCWGLYWGAKRGAWSRPWIEASFCLIGMLFILSASQNHYYSVAPSYVTNVAFLVIAIGLGSISPWTWLGQVVLSLVACWVMLAFVAPPDEPPFYFFLLTGVAISFLAFLSRIVVIRERVTLEVALIDKAAKLEAASRAKDRFLANMTHELRTPMTGVLGMVDLLRETPLNTEQAQMLKTAKTSAGYLMAIINDILDYSKLEAGKFHLKPEPMEAVSVTRDVVEMLRGQAEGKQISVTVHPPAQAELWVQGDSVRIGQVLFNLVGNAIKFTDKGGVDIYLDAEVTEQAVMLDWRVQDTGAGIPQERIIHLFDRFEQLDDTATRRATGTGLGLAIIKELVSMMDGEIGVKSTMGEGSEFRVRVTLPRTVPPVAAAQPEPEGATVTLDQPLRILVAEDNPVNQILVRKLLEKEGWSMTVTDNGEAAVAAATKAEEGFDLILMDVRMPVMDGPTATRIIKDKMAAPPPVVALTANTMKEDVAAYREAGMDAIVGKPIDMDELKRVIAGVLAR